MIHADDEQRAEVTTVAVLDGTRGHAVWGTLGVSEECRSVSVYSPEKHPLG